MPGESYGQRGLAGYSPWGHGGRDTAEQLSTRTGIVAARTNYLKFDDLNTNALPYSLVGWKPVVMSLVGRTSSLGRAVFLLEALGETLLDFPASRTPTSPLFSSINPARHTTSISYHPRSATQNGSLLLKSHVIRLCPPG